MLWSMLGVIVLIVGSVTLFLYPSIRFDNLRQKLIESSKEERPEIIAELRSYGPSYLSELQSLFERRDPDLTRALCNLYISGGHVSFQLETDAGGTTRGSLRIDPALGTLTDAARFYLQLCFLDRLKDMDGIESVIAPLMQVHAVPFPQIEVELLRRLEEHPNVKVQEEIAKRLARMKHVSDLVFPVFMKIAGDESRSMRLRFIVAHRIIRLPESDARREKAAEPIIALTALALEKKQYDLLENIITYLASTMRADILPLLEKIVAPESINEFPGRLVEESAKGLAGYRIRRHGKLMMDALGKAEGSVVRRALMEGVLVVFGGDYLAEIRKYILALALKDLELHYDGLVFLVEKGDKDMMDLLISNLSQSSKPVKERFIAADAISLCAGNEQVEILELIQKAETNIEIKVHIGKTIEAIKRRMK